METKLSSKGQVILPKKVRDTRRWVEGTRFVVEEVPEGVLLRPLTSFSPTRLEDVFGCLHYEGRPKTLREMDEAIATGVRERRGRGRY